MGVPVEEPTDEEFAEIVCVDPYEDVMYAQMVAALKELSDRGSRRW